MGPTLSVATSFRGIVPIGVLSVFSVTRALVATASTLLRSRRVILRVRVLIVATAIFCLRVQFQRLVGGLGYLLVPW